MSDSSASTGPDQEALIAAAMKRIDGHPDKPSDAITLELVTLVAMRSPEVVRGVLSKIKPAVTADRDSAAAEVLELGRVIVQQPQEHRDIMWPLFDTSGTLMG